MYEVRNIKVGVTKSGNGSLNYKVRIPTKFIKDMELDEEKNVRITYEGKKIIIEKL